MVFLGTRVDKKKRLRKQKRKNFCKSIISIFTLLILYYGIKVVNTHIVYLDYLKDPIIFNVDFKERKIYLFGESYLIDLKIFKKSN